MLWVGLVLALAPPVEATDTLWEAVPLVTQANLNAGNSGGEGCQVIQNLAVDSTGNFLIMGTDVGGLYRSLDGGATWQPANVGFSPRGGAAFAIDPNNNNRVLAVGCDSAAHSWNGLWLSPSQGANWYRVRPLNLRGSGTYHDSVAFDPSSASVSAGVTFSSVAYWVADSDGGGGLWKSTDGGRNWSEVQTTLSDGIVKVNPASGAVYVATRNGFYRSTNGGAGFTQVLSGSVLGLDVISSRPNNVYINLGDGAYLSTDSGLSFAKLGNQGLPTSYSPGLRNLKVSPVNPQNMLINDDLGIYDHQMHFYSNDGGNTWAECSTDFSQSLTPAQEREWLFAWSPKNGQQAWTCGGSFISRTTDGGADFSWANNGFNGYTCTGIFNFNPWSPDLFLVTSQDSNSALTRNITGRPAVWQYLGVSGHGFGFNYGGYALSPLVLAAGNAASWSAPATLMLSTDGGAGWVSEGLVGDNTQASCGDPTDASAAFWDNYRTSDGGKSWFLMPACDGVFTYNSNPNGGHELYGAQGSQVVKSTDHGATWTPVVTVPDTVQDIACDWQNHRLYIVAGKSLYLYSLYGKSPPFSISYRLGPDNAGLQKVLSVAVDPVDPEIVYAGWAGSDYSSNQSVR
ncbi:MAG TPA: hypothetical protein VJ873_10085, partial [bacterium]|nr:hypothetical protein [bacterium]